LAIAGFAWNRSPAGGKIRIRQRGVRPGDPGANFIPAMKGHCRNRRAKALSRRRSGGFDFKVRGLRTARITTVDLVEMSFKQPPARPQSGQWSTQAALLEPVMNVEVKARRIAGTCMAYDGRTAAASPAMMEPKGGLKI